MKAKIKMSFDDEKLQKSTRKEKLSRGTYKT